MAVKTLVTKEELTGTNLGEVSVTTLTVGDGYNSSVTMTGSRRINPYYSKKSYVNAPIQIGSSAELPGGGIVVFGSYAGGFSWTSDLKTWHQGATVESGTEFIYGPYITVAASGNTIVGTTHDGRILTSVDSGATIISSTIASGTGISLHSYVSGFVGIWDTGGPEFGLATSQDGLSWTVHPAIDVGFPAVQIHVGYLTISGSTFVSSYNQNIGGITTKVGLVRSNDLGQTWSTSSQIPSSNAYDKGAVFLGSRVVVAYQDFNFNDNRVAITNDLGQTWTTATVPFDWQAPLTVVGNTVYTMHDGFYASSSDGLNWTTSSLDFIVSNGGYPAIRQSNGTLVAVGPDSIAYLSGGIWNFPTSPTTMILIADDGIVADDPFHANDDITIASGKRLGILPENTGTNLNDYAVQLRDGELNLYSTSGYASVTAQGPGWGGPANFDLITDDVNVVGWLRFNISGTEHVIRALPDRLSLESPRVSLTGILSLSSTSNPTPGDGDVWRSGTNMLVRLSGTTYKMQLTTYP